MNARKSLYDIKSFYDKKAVLKASFQGMRYQVEQSEDDAGGKVLQATVWPEPFSFEKTSQERKTGQTFPYSEQGLDQAYDWLCEMYESRKQDWQDVMEHPFKDIDI